MKFVFHNHSGFSPSSNGSSSSSNNQLAQHSHLHSNDSKPSSAWGAPFVRTPSQGSTSTRSTDPMLPDSEGEESHDNLQHAQQHRVQFNEDANQIHDNTLYDQDDVQALWFSREEFATFRRDTMQQAHLLVHGEEPQALHKAYQGFCNVQTSADILAVLEGTKGTTPLPWVFIGLDRWTVPDLFQDKVDRRKRIMRQIQYMQRQYRYDVDLRQDRIRQVSRTISQPSRLYAHHLAQLAARAGN